MNKIEILKFAQDEQSKIGYRLEYQEKIPCKSYYEKLSEMYRAAIPAIKEKVEREKGCEHCRGWDTRCGAKYCPMCGRKLGEQNG